MTDGQDDVVAATEPDREFASPVSRLWARLFDLWTLSAVMAVLLGALIPGIFDGPAFSGPAGNLLSGVLILPLALGVDALCMALFGTTLGKWLIGIRVETLDGRHVGKVALMRNARVYVQGLWFGLPFLNLIAMSRARGRLANDSATQWDEAVGTQVIDNGNNQLRTAAVAILALTLNFGLTIFGKYAEYKEPEWRKAEIVAALPSMNRGLPHFIDDVTRFDRIAYTAEENIISFEYTYIHRDASLVRTDELGDPAKLRLRALQAYCGSDMKPFRDWRIPGRYRYRYADGSMASEFLFEPKDCMPR